MVWRQITLGSLEEDLARLGHDAASWRHLDVGISTEPKDDGGDGQEACRNAERHGVRDLRSKDRRDDGRAQATDIDAEIEHREHRRCTKSTPHPSNNRITQDIQE